MKKFFRIVVGIAVAAGGVWATIVSFFQLLHGQWLWFVVMLAAGAIATSGIRLMAGDRVRDIAKDLLEVLMWTN